MKHVKVHEKKVYRDRFQMVAYRRQMNEDRENLLYKLKAIGFVPDTDMAEQVENMIAELKRRIAQTSAELMVLE